MYTVHVLVNMIMYCNCSIACNIKHCTYMYIKSHQRCLTREGCFLVFHMKTEVRNVIDNTGKNP